MQYPRGVFHDQNSCLPKSWPRINAFKNTLATMIEIGRLMAPAKHPRVSVSSQSASSTVGPAFPPPPGIPPPGIPPSGMPAPPAAWYTFIMIGLTMPSISFFLASTLELVFQLVVRKRVSHLEAIILQAIFGFNLLLVLLIFGTVLLCLLYHAVDLRLRKPAFFIRNSNLICLATCLVLGRHIEDAICVDVESNLNLGDTTRGWRNPIKVEFPQQVVILCHRTLTFKHLDEHSWLIVCVSRECLAFLCWDSSISLNELRHDASCSFEAHGQRSHIQQQQVLHRGGAFTPM